MEVNKALAGENSVFTRRGRNSERTFGHNDSLRSRVPPVPGPTGRSYGPQGTIELPNPILATIQQEMCVSFVNRSDDECCNGSPEREIPDVANGSLKMDEPFTNGRNSTKSDGKQGIYLKLKSSELLINRSVNVYELETNHLANHLSIFIRHFVLNS
jgi:hypothetical protein